MQADRQTDRDRDREIQSGLKIILHRDRDIHSQGIYSFIKMALQTAKES